MKIFTTKALEYFKQHKAPVLILITIVFTCLTVLYFLINTDIKTDYSTQQAQSENGSVTINKNQNWNFNFNYNK